MSHSQSHPVVTTAVLMSVVLSLAPAQTWSTLAGGVSDWVYATTVWNGDLIVGGKFTWAGGVQASHIARFNGTSWSALGPGLDGDVWALTVYQGQLIAGGSFVNAGALNVNFIASWDGSAWTDLEGGMNSQVQCLGVWNNKLIAGGYFTDANGPANHIASWDGNNWAPLGAGSGGTQGQVMAVGTYGADLIAAGFFTSAGGTPASHVAKWNGASWSTLGSGINNIPYSITNWNGQLVVGGLFATAGGVSAHDVAAWNGTSWSGFGSGVGGGVYGYVLAVTSYGGDLIAGGIFTTAGGIPAANVAKWNGYAWSPVANYMSSGGTVQAAYALSPWGVDLAVGGIFSSVDGAGSANVVKWNEPTSAYGPGCPGSANRTPVLTPFGDPRPNLVAGVHVTNGQVNGNGVLLLATAAGATPIQGCMLLLGGTIFPPLNVTLDAAGAYSIGWTLPPAVPAGAQIWFQYAGFDPGSLNGVFSASNGLRVTIQ